MSDEPNGAAEETAGGIGGQLNVDGAETASALLAGRNETTTVSTAKSAAKKLRRTRNKITQPPRLPSKIKLMAGNSNNTDSPRLSPYLEK